MKKKFAAIFLTMALLAPSVAGAQVVTPLSTQAQLTALINQTISLIQQLITKLTAQLNELQAAEDTQAQATTTPNQSSQSSDGTEQAEQTPVISIDSEGLIFRFNAPGLDDKYLADVTLTAKKSIQKLTLYYYIYSSDDSANRVQERKEYRVIDQGKTIDLTGIKYSIEMRDSRDRQVNISEWFEVTRASGTASGEPIGIGF